MSIRQSYCASIKRYIRLYRETSIGRATLVDRNFAAKRPNQLWASDITYVATWRGLLVRVSLPPGCVNHGHPSHRIASPAAWQVGHTHVRSNQGIVAYGAAVTLSVAIGVLRVTQLRG